MASQFTDHNLKACTHSMPFFHTVYTGSINFTLHFLAQLHYLHLEQEVARVVGHVRRFLRFAVSKDVVLSLSNAFNFNPAKRLYH